MHIVLSSFQTTLSRAADWQNSAGRSYVNGACLPCGPMKSRQLTRCLSVSPCLYASAVTALRPLSTYQTSGQSSPIRSTSVHFHPCVFCLFPWDIAPALHLSTSILVCFVYFPGTLLQLYICPLPSLCVLFISLGHCSSSYICPTSISLCVLFISLGHCSSSTSVHFHPCVFCLFPWDIAPALHLSTSILVCFVYFPGTLLQLYICPLPSLCVLFISLGHCSSSTSVHFHPCVFCLFPWDIAPALNISVHFHPCVFCFYFCDIAPALHLFTSHPLCVLFISLGHCSSFISVHFYPCVFYFISWDICSSSTSVHFHPCVFLFISVDKLQLLHLSTSILVCFVYFPGTLLQLYICPLPSLCVLFTSLGHCSSSISVHLILVCFVYFPGTLLQLYICPLPSLCILFISPGTSLQLYICPSLNPCVFCLLPWDIAPALYICP
ncbi:hypothetical protein RRG08_045651, partial [Elysia crispata]